MVEERLRFVARLLDGEAMAEVSRAFGISRKTGNKIFERCKEHGLEAVSDRSRRPVRYATSCRRNHTTDGADVTAQVATSRSTAR